MIKFIKHYALEIYTVLAMAFIVYTAMLNEISFIQKLVVIDAFLFILHEWEEGRYPGGFVNLIVGLIGVEVNEETKRASRIPAGILLLLLSIVPFVYHDVPLITMAIATFGIIEGFVHTMGIRLFRMKRFYTPGMAGTNCQWNYDCIPFHEPSRPMVRLCVWPHSDVPLLRYTSKDYDTYGWYQL